MIEVNGAILFFARGLGGSSRKIRSESCHSFYHIMSTVIMIHELISPTKHYDLILTMMLA